MRHWWKLQACPKAESLSRDQDMIVGYVTFHHPDEQERWSEGNMEDLIELGAIEVAKDYRSLGLGQQMIKTAFEEEQMERYIVFTTEYYWHWDLKGSGLNVWDYRKMMERLMKIVDMGGTQPTIRKSAPILPTVSWSESDGTYRFHHKNNSDRIRFRQRFMY